VEVADAELVGLVPATAVARAARDAVALLQLDADHVVEAAALRALG